MMMLVTLLLLQIESGNVGRKGTVVSVDFHLSCWMLHAEMFLFIFSIIKLIIFVVIYIAEALQVHFD